MGRKNPRHIPKELQWILFLIAGDQSGVADVSYDDAGTMLANIVTKENVYVIEVQALFSFTIVNSGKYLCKKIL